MIKAAFFDIDSTLYSWEERRFIPSAIEAIKKAKKKGLKVFLCSSRPYHSMYHFGLMDLGIRWDGWVGCGGAVVCLKNKVIYQEEMEASLARKFIRFASSQGCDVQAIGPKCRYYPKKTGEFFASYASTFSEPYAPTHPYRGGTLVGFLLFAPEKYDEIFKTEFPELTFSRFHEYGLDVTPMPRNKGCGAAAIVKALGIKKEEAVGFGDDLADIDMLEGLGHLVAMGNAKAEVKEAATYITTDIHEDGIANALKHYGY